MGTYKVDMAKAENKQNTPHSRVSLQSLYRKPIRRPIIRFSRRPFSNPLPMTTARQQTAASSFIFRRTFPAPAPSVVFAQTCGDIEEEPMSSPATSPIPRMDKDRGSNASLIVKARLEAAMREKEEVARIRSRTAALKGMTLKTKNDSWDEITAWS